MFYSRFVSDVEKKSPPVVGQDSVHYGADMRWVHGIDWFLKMRSGPPVFAPPAVFFHPCSGPRRYLGSCTCIERYSVYGVLYGRTEN